MKVDMLVIVLNCIFHIEKTIFVIHNNLICICSQNVTINYNILVNEM